MTIRSSEEILSPLRTQLEELEESIETQRDKIAAIKSSLHEKDHRVVAMMDFAINIEA